MTVEEAIVIIAAARVNAKRMYEEVCEEVGEAYSDLGPVIIGFDGIAASCFWEGDQDIELEHAGNFCLDMNEDVRHYLPRLIEWRNEQ